MNYLKTALTWLGLVCLLALSGCGETTRPGAATPDSATSSPTTIAPATTARPSLEITAQPATPATGPNQALPANTSTSTALPVETSPITPAVTSPVPATSTAAASNPALLLVSNFAGRHVSFIDPLKGAIERLEVGSAPWGLAQTAGNRVYVATAEGIAVVDSRARQRLALIPYRSNVGPPQTGEYRPGGMGLAASPDGKFVYVGVHLQTGQGRLEVLDTEKQAIVGSAPVGLRPFQILVSPDGRQVYSIDHDSYSVTVVDAASLAVRTLDVAPVGRGAFDKLHYGVVLPTGRLLLPVQGLSLVDLDPTSGRFTTRPLTAATHQHGVALTPDLQRLLIVGTGPAGSVTGPPSLTIRELSSGKEEIIKLARPHENVLVSADGRRAYLTGGYNFANQGWDGLTIIDLNTRTMTELPVPDRPLDIIQLKNG